MRYLPPLLLCALVACSDPAAPELQSSQRGIVGGEAESGWPAVGAITFSQFGTYLGPICTGTLIDRTWVLTAAHCLQDPDQQRLDPRDLHFFIGVNGNESPGGRPDEGRWVPVAQTFLHPRWAPNTFDFSTNDIGLIRLDEPVDNVDPIPLNHARLDEAFVGDEVFYVGFGVSDGIQHTGGGAKQSVTLRVEGVRPTRYYSGADAAGVCYGDSGGPGLARFGNGWRVVGVNSALGYSDDESEPCIGAAIHVRVDAHLAWIRRVIGGGPGCGPRDCQCEASCQPDGSCDDRRCAPSLSCAGIIDCAEACRGDQICLINCQFDGSTSALEALYDLLSCAEWSCPDESDVRSECVERECASEMVECDGGARPRETPCPAVWDCVLACGGPHEPGCFRACQADLVSPSFDRVVACAAPCSRLVDEDEWSACAAATCQRELRACLPPDGCRVTGGSCGPATACRPTPWGGSRCFPTRERDQGRRCDEGSPELGLDCADGLVCTTRGQCATACVRDAHCGQRERCDRGAAEVGGLGACVPGPRPPPPPPPDAGPPDDAEVNPDPVRPRPDAAVPAAPGRCNRPSPPDDCDGEEAVADRAFGCSTTPGGAGWLGLLLLWRRRSLGQDA